MIGSVGNSSMMSMMQQMQGPRGGGPPPKHDTDGSGGLNETELLEAASQFEEMTGQVMDVEDILANYDADGDGEISREEMKGYMDEQGFTPPPPPPAMSTEMLLQMQGGDSPMGMNQGYAAYDQTGEDILSQLLSTLAGEDESTSSIATTA